MNYKFNITLIFAAILVFSACRNFDDLLDDPNAVAPENAEIDFVFNKVQIQYADFFAEVTELTQPIVRMTGMTFGNMYENQWGPTSYDDTWEYAYAGLLPDIESVITTGNEKNLLMHVGAAKVLKAHMMMTLVDMFGNVPYSETNKGLELQNPVADDDKAVYAAALGLLDEAIADLGKPRAGAISPDIFYGGDAALWVKAANSLKLRYYLNTRLENNDSKGGINGLITAGNLITSNSEDFQFNYGTNRVAPDSRHPFYEDGYENDPDWYQSNYYMWSMLEEKVLPDPRLRYYFYRQDCDTTDEDQFTLDCVAAPRPQHYDGPYPWCVASDDGYWGRDHGNNDGIPPDGDKRTVFGLYPGGGKFDADNCSDVFNSGTDGLKGPGIEPIMLASYVDFMLAESALMLGTSGDPRTHLEGGVRKSLDKVINFAPGEAPADLTPTADDMDAYVKLVTDAYDAATSDDERMNVIAKEYHIALFGNGLEAYNMHRRTGMPWGMQPTRELDHGTYPRLMLYPNNYVNLNSNASQRGISEQVFWDTNPAGFIK